MTMSKTDEIVIDQEVVEAVAAKAAESVKASLSIPTADEIAEKIAEKSEKTVKKNIHEEAEKTPVTVKGMKDLTKEARFAKAVMAQKNGNASILAEYNDYAMKAWAEKANYQNVTTTADGGALVPDPEFVAEIERLTDEYGVVARLATIRRTDRDSVTLLSGSNEISFTRTNEATAQNAQKLTYTAATVALDKYITTLVMTSELIEDSAIDIFADATNEIARARAKLFDQLVFTDSTYGLLSADVGDTYKTQTVGTAITDFDFDDAMDSTYKVVSSARRNGRFFMHPTVWNELRQKKTGDGTNASASYYAGAPMESPTPMIDGYMVELVDVMPHVGDITANEAFAVFGDLSRVQVHVKRLLETKSFDSGVVKDAGGSDINLITQDSWAMRATLRCVPQTRFQGAFTILGTGTVS
jgi:HK97 family phage major capsid protein